MCLGVYIYIYVCVHNLSIYLSIYLSVYGQATQPMAPTVDFRPHLDSEVPQKSLGTLRKSYGPP